MAKLLAEMFCVLVCSIRLVALSAESPQALDQCRSNLTRIYSAIQNYRTNNHQLPNSLRDLVPKCLPNLTFLQCPASGPELGQASSVSIRAVLSGAEYLYEFEEIPLTNGLTRGLDITLRSWRQLQMGRIGSAMPMVRCTNHAPVLTLLFNGQITDSGPEWETDLAGSGQEDLSLESLLPKYMYLKVVRIPAREPGTPPGLVDLTAYYNGSLNDWLRVGEEAVATRIKADLTVMDGVLFDIRGVIQLGSQKLAMCTWPASVSNILVESSCAEVSFLYGTLGGEGPRDIGRYIVHFEDGSTITVPIIYGVNVLDWKVSASDRIKLLEQSNKGSVGGKVASVKENGSCLYVLHWPNPLPDLRIKSIDFVSAKTQSCPFLVAISTTPPSHSQ
jgi:hypothetical protein